MVERIKEVMQVMNMSSTQFADAIDINRSNLTHLFSGRNQPSLELARKILKTFPNINTEWLIMGVGSMTTEEKETIALETKTKTIPDALDLFTQNSENSEKVKVVESNPIQPTKPSLNNSDEKVFKEKNEEKTLNDEPVLKEINASEFNNPHNNQKENQIIDSKEDKKIKKMIFLYADNSFEVFTPSN